MRYVKLCLLVMYALGLTLGFARFAGADASFQPHAHAQSGALKKFLRGRDLFLNEEFDGNGRTCASCHLRQERGDNFDFTPDDAQALFDEDPAHPLFSEIDQDPDGSFSTLLTHGLVRIPFVLPPNVTVLETDSPLVDVDPMTGETTVTVWRSTPSIENIALPELVMWDGRFFNDELSLQAIEAVRTHYGAFARDPTLQEAEDMAFFQQKFFTNRALRRFARGGRAPRLPKVPARNGEYWASVARGRNFFVDMPVDPSNPVRGGHCATCHSGPMLDATNEFNPVQPAGITITNNFSTETNIENPAFPPGSRVGIGLPEHTYMITLEYDVVVPPDLPPTLPLPPPGSVLFPAGTVFTLKSSDPGRILTTGDPCELVLSCVINSDLVAGDFSTTSFLRTSSLWGSADTAPYFHDNSASNLDEVLDLYDTLFLVTAFGTGNFSWVLTASEREDIKNFVDFAFQRRSKF